MKKHIEHNLKHPIKSKYMSTKKRTTPQMPAPACIKFGDFYRFGTR